MRPETRYAKSGDVHIAYQVIGNGPMDLVVTPGSISHLEYGWEESSFTRYRQRLASFSRLIIFDKRGTGMSDRVAGIPTLEERTDDIRAVMDAAGSERAVLYGTSEGAPMSIVFAATYPKRTLALILYGGIAKGVWASDYPWAVTREEYQKNLDQVEREWGSPTWVARMVSGFAPSRAYDERFKQWLATYLRLGASPGARIALSRMNMEIDVRHVLPVIHVPTLILHRASDSLVSVEHGRYIAERIPSAKYVELPGIDHLVFADQDSMDAVIKEIEKFLSGIRPSTEADRVLATVLFTDIVGSTERAADIGDQQWHELIDSHNALARREFARFRGREIKTTGDGFLATFDGPTRGIRCACALCDAVRPLEIELRAGLHTGECEMIGREVGGIAVHIAARVVEKAGAGEVLVSSTVKDLVAGSGLQFADRGTHVLKGIPREWHLFAVK